MKSPVNRDTAVCVGENMSRHKLITVLAFGWMLAGGRALAGPINNFNNKVEWSIDGSTMVAVSGSNLQVLDAYGNQVKALVLDSSPSEIHLSPDGQRVSYVVNYTQLWILRFSDGSKTQIFSPTRPMQTCGDVRWSPTGQSLSYAVTTAGNPIQTQVFIVQADGTGNKLLMTYNP